MNIQVGFQDEILGIGSDDDSAIVWSGEVDRLRGLAGFYERQGFRGRELLQEMLRRLQGRWWAKEISELDAEFRKPFDASEWEPHVLKRGHRKGLQVWKNSRTGAYRDELAAISVSEDEEPVTLQPIKLPTDDEIKTHGVFRSLGINSLNDRSTGSITIGSKKYFWKGIPPEKVQAETLASDLAGMAGVQSLASKRVDNPQRLGLPSPYNTGMVSEWCDKKTLTEFIDDFNKKREQNRHWSINDVAIKKLDPKDVDRNILFSWLIGHTDGHSGNYLVDNGRLISIDHEMSLSPWVRRSTVENSLGNSALFHMRERQNEAEIRQHNVTNPNWMPRRNEFSPVLDKAVVQDMAHRAEQMASHVRRQKPDGMTPDAIAEVADMIAERGNMLRQLAAKPKCTIAELESINDKFRPDPFADLGSHS